LFLELHEQVVNEGEYILFVLNQLVVYLVNQSLLEFTHLHLNI
jgi:hypothetical protein